MDEAQKLLEKLKESEQTDKKRKASLYDISLLSLQCGLRFGEIANLTWNCIDLDQKQISIRDPKNNQDRVVPMTEAVREMLQSRKQSASQQLAFPNKNGQPMNQISKYFYQTVKDIGLNNNCHDTRDKVNFHTLRHTYASWLKENGTDLYTIKELLGHKSISMTERYSHIGPNTMKDAVNNLSKKIQKETDKEQTS